MLPAIAGIVGAFLVVYAGWTIFQSGRGVAHWVSPITGLTGRNYSGSPINEVLSTSFQGFQLISGYFLQPQLNGETVTLWSRLLNLLVAAAPFLPIVVFRPKTPEWVLGVATFCGLLASLDRGGPSHHLLEPILPYDHASLRHEPRSVCTCVSCRGGEQAETAEDNRRLRGYRGVDHAAGLSWGVGTRSGVARALRCASAGPPYPCRDMPDSAHYRPLGLEQTLLTCTQRDRSWRQQCGLVSTEPGVIESRVRESHG